MNNSIQQEIISQSSDLPWLVFRLQQNYYTVNSRIVTTILLLPDNITPVATSVDMFRGIINYRKEILPLLDMRKFFGLRTIQQELEELRGFIVTAKDSHKNWFGTFKQCFENDEPFTLALDPTMCEVGKWIGTYVTDAHAMKIAIAHLAEVHNQLHRRGAELLRIKKDKMLLGDEREQKIEEGFDFLSKTVVAVCNLIDGLETAFVQSHSEMGIVLSNGASTLCIIVDEVVAVDELNIVTDKGSFLSFQERDFVVGIAHSQKIPGQEIMIVSESELINVLKRYESNSG